MISGFVSTAKLCYLKEAFYEKPQALC